jgi:hypothetical protein
MYRQRDPQSPLGPEELRRALRKHINVYQLQATSRLTSGRDHWEWFVGQAGGSRREFIYMNLQARPPSGEILARLMSDRAQGDPVTALVLDGRWVARCPDCLTGQEVVDPAEPLFSCLNGQCLSVGNGHWPRPVVFPPEGVQRSLAGILLARPNPVNRNWDPEGLVTGRAETLADLRRENLDHGMPEEVAVEAEV